MKIETTILRLTGCLGLALIGLSCASTSFGDDQTQSTEQKQYSGTVTAVNPTERTLSVKGFLFSKEFNTSDACKVTLEDRPEANLEALQPGHKVDVRYRDVAGVLVAGEIIQHNQVFKGHLTAIDPGRRTLIVKGSAGTRDFTAAADCSVLLHDERVGTLENLQVGHTVSVAYDPADGGWAAHKIEQRAELFVGTIQAIDAETRTVKAKSFMSEKKFNLGDGCLIVAGGSTEGKLRDLRIGDRVAFSYENVNGVLVANRVGPDPSQTEAEAAPTAKVTTPQP